MDVNYPCVFMPQFRQEIGSGITNLFITGIVQETRPAFVANVANGTIPLREMTEPSMLPDDLVYGVPLVIGSRKGFPNFNEFAVQTIANFTRKLELRRANGKLSETNQMWIIGISNVFAMETWNS